MIRSSVFCCLAWLVGGAAIAQGPTPSAQFVPVGNISQLMIDMIYPDSDAIFYVERNPPNNDQEWNALRGTALALAESGNLLMMAPRARDQDNWIKDSRLLVEAGREAYQAASRKDLQAVVDVNDHLYNSCVVCHAQYRPNYRAPRPVQAAPPANGNSR
jgi:hypothetical protein